MTIEIRRALSSEASVLTEIAFAAKRRWDYPEEWILLWSEDLTVDNTYIEEHYVYTASEDSRVVGWCALSIGQESLSIEHCWVIPDSAGRGIGRMLVDQAFALAAELNWPALSVISDPNAEGFYRQLGFRRIGERPSVPEGRRLPILEAQVRKPDDAQS